MGANDFGSITPSSREFAPPANATVRNQFCLLQLNTVCNKLSFYMDASEMEVDMCVENNLTQMHFKPKRDAFKRLE
jgi:hypothetical protein